MKLHASGESRTSDGLSLGGREMLSFLTCITEYSRMGHNMYMWTGLGGFVRVMTVIAIRLEIAVD